MTAQNALEVIFEMPENLDIKSRIMFGVLAGNLSEESKHMAMPMVQQMLMERVIRHYVFMRDLEDEGDVKKVPLMRYHADVWLKCTAELNKVVARTQSKEARELYMERVTQVIMTALEQIEDIKERRRMAELFTRAVDAAGL